MGWLATILTWVIASALGHIIYTAFLKEPWAKYLEAHLIPWFDRHEEPIMKVAEPIMRFFDRRRRPETDI